MPLLILGMTGCVKYNGQGKPGKSSNSQSQVSSDASSVNSGESSISSASEASSGSNADSSSVAPASSSSQTPSSQETNADELPKGTQVKVYLVFGEYGKYKGTAVNSKVASLFLEHTMELTANVGDALPGADDVTSSVSGSKFVAWTAYNNDGKLTSYTKVPGYKDKILYASFSGGQGGSYSGNSGSGSSETPSSPASDTPASEGNLPTTGYGFKFSDGSYMQSTRVADDNGFEQHRIDHRSFTKDQLFQLYNFEKGEGWVVDVDGYSFGGTSSSDKTWQSYLSIDYTTRQYKVMQDFNVEAIYIKLKFGEDQIYFQLEK